MPLAAARFADKAAQSTDSLTVDSLVKHKRGDKEEANVTQAAKPAENLAKDDPNDTTEMTRDDATVEPEAEDLVWRLRSSRLGFFGVRASLDPSRTSATRSRPD